MWALVGLLAVAASGHPSEAKGPFSAVWVEDLKAQAGDAGFDKYLVAGGVYNCESCRPPRSYPADGKMRPIPGDISVLSEGVTIAGPHRIVTRIVDREMARVTTMTVSPDGQTATYVSLDKWPGKAKRLRTEYIARRTVAAPKGANEVSGTWVGIRYVSVPVEYRSVRLKEADGLFTRINFRSGTYTAKIGGPDAPVTSDGKDIFRASVTAPDAWTRVETITLNGKPRVIRTYRLSPDGRTLTTTAKNPSDGSAYIATSHRR